MQQANLKRMKFGLTHFFPRKPSSRSRFIRLCFGKPGFLPDSSTRRVLPQWTSLEVFPQTRNCRESILWARQTEPITESEQDSEILRAGC